MSFANESEPMPPRPSHLRVSAIKVEPSSANRHAACDGQGRRPRVPAVLIQALGDLTAPDFAAAGSADGRAWIAALPALSSHLARQWELTVTSEWFRHGYNAVVLPVAQGGRPLALKLTWPPGHTRGEAQALAAWRGRGAVELVAADMPRGALLLERLDASRSLASIPLAQAAATAGALIRTLAIQAPAVLPRTAGRRPPTRRHIRRPPALAPGPRSTSAGHAGRPARRRPGR